MRVLLIILTLVIVGCNETTSERSSVLPGAESADNKNSKNNKGSSSSTNAKGGDGGKSGNSNEGVSGFLNGSKFEFIIQGDNVEVIGYPGAADQDVTVAQASPKQLNDALKDVTVKIGEQRILGYIDVPNNGNVKFKKTFRLINTNDPLVVSLGKVSEFTLKVDQKIQGFDLFGTYYATYGADGFVMVPPIGFHLALAGAHAFYWHHSEGKLYGSGSNTSGQLGLADRTTSTDFPKEVGSANDGSNLSPHSSPQKVIAASGGSPLQSLYSGILLESGDLLVTGYKGPSGASLMGNGSGIPDDLPDRVKAPDGVKFIDFSLGRQYGCAIDTNYKIYCWGKDQYDQAGLEGRSVAVPTEIKYSVDGGRAIAISNKEIITCFIAFDTRYLYCMGGNHGVNPKLVTSPEGAGVKFASLDTGAGHVCVVSEDGGVYCEGENLSYQVTGIPEQSQPLSKIVFPGNRKVKKISAGADYTCALTFDNLVYCWGGDGIAPEEGMGFLYTTSGDKVALDLSPLGGATVIDISCAVNSRGICLYTTNGYWCIGYGAEGQLGVENAAGEQVEWTDLTKVRVVD